MLHSLLDALESRFASQELANRSLVSLLNSLASHLQTHFEFEESEDYFSSLSKRAPRLSSEIARLQAEHHELLREVDDMIAKARVAFAEHKQTPTLACQYIEFLKQFEEHEAAEKKLLQEAYNLDIGSKD